MKALAWLLLALAAHSAGCGASAGRAGPSGPSGPSGSAAGRPAPAPILADAPTAPGSAEVECATVVSELRRYSECGLIDDDRRAYLVRWLEAVQTDLALAKSPDVGEAAKRELAVSCRKAGLALTDAASRCAAQAATR